MENHDLGITDYVTSLLPIPSFFALLQHELDEIFAGKCEIPWH